MIPGFPPARVARRRCPQRWDVHPGCGVTGDMLIVGACIVWVHLRHRPHARSLWRWVCVQRAQRECTTLASISPYTVMPLPLRALVSEGW